MNARNDSQKYGKDEGGYRQGKREQVCKIYVLKALTSVASQCGSRHVYAQKYSWKIFTRADRAITTMDRSIKAPIQITPLSARMRANISLGCVL